MAQKIPTSEAPCCCGLVRVTEEAIQKAGLAPAFRTITVSTDVSELLYRQ